MSCIVATQTPTSSAAVRTNSCRRMWSSTVPCEKLNRATLIPAPIISRTLSSESIAGPSVATIFVFLFMISP